ncbi:DUF6221 family protein [Streptomyces sp. NPDC057654]|uniref:DUF6221 family protein n=1 Tax=Streptomyces sp. NPDC057654 TaxID=3346196 RepID=UPI0036BCA231
MSNNILAWTKNAIEQREQAAREACDDGEGRWHSGWRSENKREDGETGGERIGDERDEHALCNEGRRSSEAQSIHIALNDPASVLRRCAADRKLLELHGDRCHSCPAKGATGYCDEWTEFDCGDVCPVVTAVGESYGWAENEKTTSARPAWLAKVTSFAFRRTVTRSRQEAAEHHVCFTVVVTIGGETAIGREAEVQMPIADAERLGQQMLRIATYQREQMTARPTTDSPDAASAGQAPPTEGDQTA